MQHHRTKSSTLGALALDTRTYMHTCAYVLSILVVFQSTQRISCSEKRVLGRVASSTLAVCEHCDLLHSSCLKCESQTQHLYIHGSILFTVRVVSKWHHRFIIVQCLDSQVCYGFGSIDRSHLPHCTCDLDFAAACIFCLDLDTSVDLAGVLETQRHGENHSESGG